MVRRQRARNWRRADDRQSVRTVQMTYSCGLVVAAATCTCGLLTTAATCGLEAVAALTLTVGSLEAAARTDVYGNSLGTAMPANSAAWSGVAATAVAKM